MLLFFPSVKHRRLILVKTDNNSVVDFSTEKILNYRFYRIQDAYKLKKMIKYDKTKSSRNYKFFFVDVEKSEFEHYKNIIENNSLNEIENIFKNNNLEINTLENNNNRNNNNLEINNLNNNTKTLNYSPFIFNNIKKQLNQLQTNLNLNENLTDITNKEIINFIKNSVNLKPNFLKIDDLDWKLLVRGVLRGDNILITGHRGEGKTFLTMALAAALNRPLFKFNFGNMQDAQTALIGKTHLDVKTGTFFAQSEFVKAITTPNAIILLDELSRGTDDAFNIIFPVLDYLQRYLRINDDPNTPVVNVAPGVTFIATANIGVGYSSTRSIDIALRDRFSIKIEMKELSTQSRIEIFKNLYPEVDDELITRVAKFIAEVNKKHYSGELSFPVSTRSGLQIVGLINDGFKFEEAITAVVLSDYPSDNTVDSERVFVKQILQGFCVDTI